MRYLLCLDRIDGCSDAGLFKRPERAGRSLSRRDAGKEAVCQYSPEHACSLYLREGCDAALQNRRPERNLARTSSERCIRPNHLERRDVSL
jgi:hypothetical protein